MADPRRDPYAALMELERRLGADHPRVAKARDYLMSQGGGRSEPQAPSETAQRRAAMDLTFTPQNEREQGYADRARRLNEGAFGQVEQHRYPSGDVVQMTDLPILGTTIPQNLSRHSRYADDIADALGTDFGSQTLAAIPAAAHDLFDVAAEGANSATLRLGDDALGMVYDAATGGDAGEQWAQRTNDFGEALWRTSTAGGTAQFGGVLAGALAPTQVATQLARAPGQVGAFFGNSALGRSIGAALGGHAAVQGYAQGEGNFDAQFADETLSADIGEVFGAPTGSDLGQMRYAVPALGAGLSYALPAAGSILGGVARSARRAVEPLTERGSTRRAQEIIAQDLGDEGLARMRDEQSPGMMAADMTAAAQQRASSAGRLGGEGADRLRGDLTARGESRRERMLETFGEHIGAPKAVRQAPIEGSRAHAADLDAQRRAMATGRGYGRGEGLRVSDEAVPDNLKDPTLELPEGYTWRDWAREIKRQADDVGLGKSGRQIEIMREGAEAPSGLRRIPDDAYLTRYSSAQLKALLRNRGLPVSVNRDARLGRVSEALNDADRRQILRTLREADGPSGPPRANSDAPSVPRLRAIKMAANDMAESAGRAGDRNMASAASEFGDRVRAVLAEGVRDASGRRVSFIGDEYFKALSRAIEAFETASGIKAADGSRAGGGLFRATPESLQAFVDTLKAARRRIADDTRLATDVRRNLLAEFDKAFEAYKVGAVRSYLDFLQSSPVSKSARVFNDDSVQMQARLSTIFDDPDDLARYLRTVDDEGTMQATERQALGGSQTAERLATDADTVAAAGGRQFDVLSSVRGALNDIVADYILKRLGTAKLRVIDGMTKRVTDKLADMLRRTDLADLADEIEAAQRAGRDVDPANLRPSTQAKIHLAVEDEASGKRFYAKGPRKPGDRVQPIASRRPDLGRESRVSPEDLARAARKGGRVTRLYDEKTGKIRRNVTTSVAVEAVRREQMKVATLLKKATRYRDAWRRSQESVLRATADVGDFDKIINDLTQQLHASTRYIDDLEQHIDELSGALRESGARTAHLEREVEFLRAPQEAVAADMKALLRELPDDFHARFTDEHQEIADRLLRGESPAGLSEPEIYRLYVNETSDLVERYRRMMQEEPGATPYERREIRDFEGDVRRRIADRTGQTPREVTFEDRIRTPDGDAYAYSRFNPQTRTFEYTISRVLRTMDSPEVNLKTPSTFKNAVIDEEVAHMFDELGTFNSRQRASIIREAERFMAEHFARSGEDLMAPYQGAGREMIERELIAKYLARGGLESSPNSLLVEIWRAVRDLIVSLKRLVRDDNAPDIARRFRENKFRQRFEQRYQERYSEGLAN